LRRNSLLHAATLPRIRDIKYLLVLRMEQCVPNLEQVKAKTDFSVFPPVLDYQQSCYSSNDKNGDRRQGNDG
jgi:hypothetical protein